MPFPTDQLDAETLGSMRKFDAAWEEVGFTLAREDTNPTAVRILMSVRIMAAVRDRERDPERLTELALETVAMSVRARPPGLE
jgi:hypothetical protein